jgi:nitrogen regulatory protein PII
MQIETVVSDGLVDATIKAIVGAAKTGEIGDGRVFVTAVAASYKIRTGERET